MFLFFPFYLFLVLLLLLSDNLEQIKVEMKAMRETLDTLKPGIGRENKDEGQF